MDNKLTPSQLSLLREEEGIASAFDEDLKVLISQGFASCVELQSGSLKWTATEAGLQYAQQAA